MLLSARILNGLAGVNSFQYAQVAQLTSGEQQDIFFQLIDASKNPANEYFYPLGLRWMPSSPATLQIRLASVDDAKSITRYASQPYPTQDPSIWKLTVLPGDAIVGTFALQMTLNDAGVIRKGVLQQAVQVGSLTQSFC